MIARLLLVLLPLFLLSPLTAQDPVPTTTQDPAINMADLDFLLTPLMRAEVKVEADAWLALLQERCRAIATRQVEARSTQDAARKTTLLQEVARLTEARTGLTDRLDFTVAALRAKGGSEDEVKNYRLYIASVSGLKLDVTDTSAAWTTLVNWVKSPEGGIRLGKNILFFLLTLLAFRFLSRIAGNLMGRALGGFQRTSDLLRQFFVKSVRRVVFFIGIVVALSMLEINVGPFLAVIGAAGFVIGFALQGTLSNFASGIMILFYRPYDIGHYVTVAGVSGTVEAMSLVSTSVKTPDNQTLVVPNGSIWGGIITNVTGKDTRRVDLKFGVSYGDDLAKTEAILRRVAVAHPLVLKDPEPVIRVHELGDSSVNFIVRPWTKTSDYWTVYWDLTRTVKEQFDKEGVSIPFPQRDVHVHQIAAG